MTLSFNWSLIRYGAITGALGIMSGYAVFLLSLEESVRPSSFILALICAAVVSLVFEWFRETIQGQHKGAETRHRRFVVTFTMIATAELFVMSWDHAATIDATIVRRAAQSISGHGLSRSYVFDFVVLAGFWVVVGAVLGGRMAALVPKVKQSLSAKDVARNALAGCVAGLVFAPLGLLVYILISRVVIAVQALVFHHDDWLRYIAYRAAEYQRNREWMSYAPLKVLLVADQWLGSKWWSFTIAFAVLSAVSVYLFRKRLPQPAVVLIIAMLTLLWQPLTDYTSQIGAMLLAAVVWTIPGTVIGAAIPLLRHPSKIPNIWRALSFGAAIFLCAGAVFRQNAWLVLPAIFLIVTGCLVHRGHAIADYWPYLALSVATSVSAATLLTQQITFTRVIAPLHQINGMPAIVFPEGESIGSQAKSRPLDSSWSFSLSAGTISSFNRSLPKDNSVSINPDQSLKLHALSDVQRQLDSVSIKAKEQEVLLQELSTARTKLLNQLQQISRLTGAAARIEKFGESVDEHELLQKEATELLEKVHRLRKAADMVYTPLSLPLLIISSTDAELSDFSERLNETHITLRGDLDRQEAALQEQLKRLREMEDHLLAPLRTSLGELTARWLEVCITGSLGFWLTVGILACCSRSPIDGAAHQAVA